LTGAPASIRPSTVSSAGFSVIARSPWAIEVYCARVCWNSSMSCPTNRPQKSRGVMSFPTYTLIM
jgi:hypothetical protein